MQLSFYISENSILKQKARRDFIGKRETSSGVEPGGSYSIGSWVNHRVWLVVRSLEGDEGCGTRCHLVLGHCDRRRLDYCPVYAELGGMLPRSGGIIRYPQYSHGSLVGYMQSFAGMLGFSTVISIEAEGTLRYASSWIPGLYVANQGPTFLGWLVQAVIPVLVFLLKLPRS